MGLLGAGIKYFCEFGSDRVFGLLWSGWILEFAKCLGW